MKLTASFLFASLAWSQITVTAKTQFLSDGLTGQVGWSTWGANDKILYSKWATDRYELYVINPDGTGGACITCAMAGLPANVSRGAGTFSPDGAWITFLAQKVGGDPTKKPGNGTDYDVWVTDWPVVNGPWKQTPATTATLWPNWSPGGRMLLWTQFYAAEDGTHPLGYWTIKINSFTAGNPPTVSLLTLWEFGAYGGLYELGDWLNSTHVSIMANATATLPSYHAFDLYDLDVATGDFAILNNHAENAWDEFARFPFTAGASPFMFFTSSRAYSHADIFISPQITPRGDVYYQDRRGYTVTADSPRRLTWCNVAGDSMYVGANVATFCTADGFSPDGTKMLATRQTDSGRDLWILTLKWTAGLRLGARITSGGRIQ